MKAIYAVLLGLWLAFPAMAAERWRPTELPLDREMRVLHVYPEKDLFLERGVLERSGFSTLGAVRTASVLAAPKLPADAAFVVRSGSAGSSPLDAVTDGIARSFGDDRIAAVATHIGSVDVPALFTSALAETLPREGLANGFVFYTEPVRTKVGSKSFDEAGRALAVVVGAVSITPRLRALRVYLMASIEDRRVIRDRDRRLDLERIPLRQADVAWLLPLPGDTDELSLDQRRDLWQAQDAAALHAAIAEGARGAVALLGQQLAAGRERGAGGREVRFDIDAGSKDRGIVLSETGGRIVIWDGKDSLWSVPAERVVGKP